MQKKLHEIMSRLVLFTKVKNWPVVLWDYFGFMKPGDYVVELHNGCKFICRAGSADKWSLHEIVLRDDYRLRNISASQKGVAIDLGANAGFFSVYFAFTHPDFHVFAYEPDVANFSYVQKNIRLNGLEKQITAFCLGCAKKSGKIKLYLSSDNRAYSITEKRSQQFEMINVVSLADIMRKNKITRCDLLKMDIEGAEYEVLYSLPTSNFTKISVLALEYHNQKYVKHTGTALQSMLTRLGYVTDMVPEGDSGMGFIYAVQ